MYKRLLHIIFSTFRRKDAICNNISDENGNADTNIFDDKIQVLLEIISKLKEEFMNPEEPESPNKLQLQEVLNHVLQIINEIKKQQRILNNKLLGKEQQIKLSENKILNLQEIVEKLELQVSSQTDYENALDSLLKVLKQNGEGMLLMQHNFSVMNSNRKGVLEGLKLKIAHLEEEIVQKNEENLRLRNLLGGCKIEDEEDVLVGPELTIVAFKNASQNNIRNAAAHEVQQKAQQGGKEEVPD